MIKQLNEIARRPLSILLALMTAICFSLSVFRVQVTGSPLFLFLNWNLFLAFIPWLITAVVVANPNYQKRLHLILLLPIWVLFFPNSPYILTDLFHLRISSNVPKWFDLVLVLSFAWTGLMYGFLSLLEIEKLLMRKIRPAFVNIISTFMLFLSGFGVYIGRYLRWNSWDIISAPSELFADISDRFVNPFDHPRTWGMTILMGLLLNMMFWTIKLLAAHRRRDSLAI